MPFTLEVEFSGPCLYIADTAVIEGTRQFADAVGVVVPDCRLKEGERLMHLDHHPAVAHVGYLRLDLGDIAQGVPRGNEQDGPKYELVHRFTGQELRFAGAARAERVEITGLDVPDFRKIAPTLDPRTDLFGPNPADVLMRMVLQGGSFQPIKVDVQWKFTNVLNPGGQEHGGKFASALKWIREFTGSSLTVTIADLAGAATEATFLLEDIPDGEIVRMKVANVCAFNPLEWNDLPPDDLTFVDEDFKWLYRLFANVPGVAVLPAPVVDLSQAGPETGDDGCMGGWTTGSITRT